MPQNRIDTIEPDLATKWLRQGVSWHDGKPFTAADVKCTWDLILGTGADKLRTNPRKSRENARVGGQSTRPLGRFTRSQTSLAKQS